MLDIEDSIDFERALWALPCPEHEVIMYELAGMSQVEIGNLMGVTQQRISQIRLSAIKKFREILAPPVVRAS